MSDKLPPKILVIEPDEVLNANLCNTIERCWFDVMRARSLENAIRLAEVNPPNVAIISSRITNKSANEIAAELKKMKGMRDLPILFLVEQNESENTTLSDQYCSEYLIRPFTPNELMTIIRSLTSAIKTNISR
tara:strand:+ start:1783 stop:2181 length:399 start_codon:yes stop_codon:yes gene_type:complete